MKQDKTVLIIAGEYPPLKTIGRIRTAKFVQHIRALGWRPVVLTLDYSEEHPLFSEELLPEIPDDVQVFRVANDSYDEILIRSLKKLLSPKPGAGGNQASTKGNPTPTKNSQSASPSTKDKLLTWIKSLFKNWINIPDDNLIWSKRAYKEALKIIDQQRIDLIYTTLPPISACLTGYKLKKASGLPWVVDYRDLWTGDVLREWIPPLRNRYEVWLEKKLIKKADAVIAVSEQKTDYLKQLHHQATCRWETLTNGYDPEVFEPLLKEPRQRTHARSFVYTGRLFKNRKGYAFAEALGLIKQQNPELADNLEVHIYGGVSPEIAGQYRLILEKYGIADHYKFHGDVAYQQAMRAQVQCDHLLLIVDTGSTSDGVIPGKLFEYIASKRPIFALTNPGATQEIIEKAQAGIVVPAEDIQTCKLQLEALLKEPVPDEVHFDQDYLSQFQRLTIAKRLAGIFNDLT